MMKKLLLFITTLSMCSLIYASEQSLYNFSWLDKDKEIYVLQNRRFRKDGRFYLGGTAAKTVNGVFVDSYGATLRGGYFFKEDWGIEGVFGKNTGKTNDVAKGVEEQQTVPYYRKIDSYMGAMLMWSPFYSKINTFNSIYYFDWMFGLGLSSIKTLDNRNDFEGGAGSSLTSENSIGGLWNTGLRFYLNDSWSLRVDFTGLHYRASKTREVNDQVLKTNRLFSHYDLGLGLNYSF
jgi:outer membrane beta-barrel protein